MKFATVDNDERTLTAAEKDGALIDLGALAAGMYNGFPPVAFPLGTDLIEAWESGNELVHAVADAALEKDLADLPTLDPGTIRFLPVVPDARQILAVGLNYMDHCREQNKTPPESPMFFAKLPSCLTGHLNPIIHWPITSQLDFEGELAVVIGKTARGVSEEDAISYCFGYTVMNDVTARELQKGDKQWIRGKGLDTFGPLGPVVVTRDELPDPQDLRIRTWVNGDTRQDCSTDEMVAGVARIVSYASQAITLRPGDIITTGTPSGVGVFSNPPCFLAPGDVVRIEIEGIGILENTVKAP